MTPPFAAVARRVLAGAALAASAAAGWAQPAWPDRPVRVIVPLPPGGSSDIVLRTALDRMQPVLGQPLVLGGR